LREGEPLQVLEPCDGKLSRTVLRGEWSRKAPDLPDVSENNQKTIKYRQLPTKNFTVAPVFAQVLLHTPKKRNINMLAIVLAKNRQP